jgi:hypothetical protein
VRRIVGGLPLDDQTPPSTPEGPRAVEDRTRKESRPGFVPNLNNPLPKPS